MKIRLTFLALIIGLGVQAQELFTWTEPASNMAAKSFGFRLTNTLMKEGASYNYHALPEIMWGVSRKVMIHAEAFLSNANGGFVNEGGGVYAKYRFYSEDEVHSHLRGAVYGRAVVNNTPIHQPAIDLNGHNSGYELGIVGTKLINKVAISAGAGLLHATDNMQNNKFTYGNDRNAVSYNLSIGKLMLPKEYVSYDQVNLNLMVELLGQSNLHSGKHFLDIGTAMQFIIMSRMRVDVGYRFAAINKLNRSASNGFLLRLEYNIFNAYK